MKNSKNFNFRGGFTLVEIALVSGIVVIISAVSLVNLYGWREEKQVSAAAQQMASVLREAGSRAMSQSQGRGWGVHFDNPTSGKSSYSLFSYDSTGATTTVNSYSLPKSLVFNTSTLPVGSVADVYFSQISGKPRVVITSQTQSAPLACNKCIGAPGENRYCRQGTCNTVCVSCAQGAPPAPITTITSSTQSNYNLALVAPRDSTVSSTITVSDLGSIAFNTFTCFFTCSQATVVLPPLPVVTIAANPSSLSSVGQNTTLSWSSQDANSCSASWTTSTATSGSVTLVPPQTTTYSITCTGAGGSSINSVVVTLPPAPILSFGANPSTITAGQSSLITWSSQNAKSCDKSWAGGKQTSGSDTVSPSATTVYGITCTGDGGTVNRSLTVTVVQPGGSGNPPGGGPPGGVKPGGR